jgi:hypothetical protein
MGCPESASSDSGSFEYEGRELSISGIKFELFVELFGELFVG